MSYRKSLIVLALFMSSAVVLTMLVYNTLDRSVAGRTNAYSAVFTDVAGLHSGDDVRVAGVRVGRVDEVTLEGNLARVSFRIDRDQALTTKTTASVTYQNIIGQRYLRIAPGEPGNGAPLPNHGQIPLERTQPSFDISYLLNGFEPLFTLLNPTQVDNLTQAIIQALQGDSSSVLTLITNTSALAQSFAGPDQVLAEVISNLNAAVTNLAGQTGKLQSAITHTRDIMAGLDSRRDRLVTSVGSVDSAVARLATILTNIDPDLQAFLNREPGFATYLSHDGKERFSYLAANLPLLLKGFARTQQEGAYSNIYPCDINVTFFASLGRIIPGIVRLASPGNVLQHSPICR